MKDGGIESIYRTWCHPLLQYQYNMNLPLLAIDLLFFQARITKRRGGFKSITKNLQLLDFIPDYA
jgi:hypothetical protein